MIGRRLTLARTSAGLSLRALAEKIDNLVSAQAISKYERDEMMPGSKVLMALARALGTTETYLLSTGGFKLTSLEFRKKQISGSKEEATVEAMTLSAVERYLEIEDILGVPSATWALPMGAPFPVRDLAEAELAASRLRAAWSLGTERIPNLAEFLEERGVKVLVLPLPPHVSGILAHIRKSQGEGDIPVVLINDSITGERQRFTLAHELGHLLLEPHPGLDEEKAAHRFSSAFLMPAEVLWSEVGKHRTSISFGELFQLKEIFKVSVQAIAYRCKDLGIFGDALFRDLFKAFTEKGWRKAPYPEPMAVAKEVPKRFERLCFRALAEGNLSEARAAELLGLSVRELGQRMDQPRELSLQ